MSLTFPTGRGHAGGRADTRLGTPEQAEPCSGHSSVGEQGDTCILCGHYEPATIKRTWQHRAQQLAHREKAWA